MAVQGTISYHSNRFLSRPTGSTVGAKAAAGADTARRKCVIAILLRPLGDRKRLKIVAAAAQDGKVRIIKCHDPSDHVRWYRGERAIMGNAIVGPARSPATKLAHDVRFIAKAILEIGHGDCRFHHARQTRGAEDRPELGVTVDRRVEGLAAPKTEEILDSVVVVRPREEEPNSSCSGR